MSNRSEKFDRAIPYILANEGSEFTNDVDDRGGATKYGITLRTAKTVPGCENWTEDDIKNLSEEKAKDIYYALFWKFEGISDQRVATKLLDVFVNLPPRNAIKVFQSSANVCGSRIVVDGLWGLRTINAINDNNPQCILEKIVLLLSQYYNSIVKVNSSQAKFLKGWLNRANRLPKE
jgi:lysozyme family protein